MYQKHLEIFNSVFLYASLISEFKTDIQEVKIWNEIVEYFGRIHCRVHVGIILKENSENKNKFYDSYNQAFRFSEKDYFSFYLGTTSTRKEESETYNREEQIHYEYIWNLISWLMRKEEILINAAPFITEHMLNEKQMETHKEYMVRRKLLSDATESLHPVIGQLIAFRNWTGTPLKIGIVNKLTMPSKKQSFSLDLSEIKKDLTAGKVTIQLISLDNIYALINPAFLPELITKENLIALIEKNATCEAMVWRRPQELWD